MPDAHITATDRFQRPAPAAPRRDKLKPDADEIRRTLDLLIEPGAVFEVRAPRLDGRKTNTASGFFDNVETAVEAIAKLSRSPGCPAVYITLNPVDQDLLARRANRIETYADQLATDTDILRRTRLLVDFDPRRKAGISSTDAEHEAALERALTCRTWLAGQGWSEPLYGDSGNGAHLIYAVDLANDAEALSLVNRVLHALAARFGDDAVDADTTVGNASRISKLYGTPTRKGDSTTTRPHRLSRIIEAPDQLEPVPAELLEALASEAPGPAQPKPGKPARPARPAAQPATGDDFFRAVNDAALGGLARWVPALFGSKARAYKDGYRVPSVDLNRDLEEDLTLMPNGIRDFGAERGHTAVDVVIEFGHVGTPKDAALWLCETIGIDPASLGWRGGHQADQPPAAPPTSTTSIEPLIAALPADQQERVQQLRGAIKAIPVSGRLDNSKQSASSTIGYALNHEFAGDPATQPIGRALCAEWDSAVGKGKATGFYKTADPNYNATAPVTVDSIFKLARASGWTGEASEDVDDDFLTPPPRPSKRMLYGLIGEIARAAGEGTEANPVAVAAALISWLSARIGRDTYFQLGDIRHHVRLYTLHVGRSQVGGKGEALGLIGRIEQAINSREVQGIDPDDETPRSPLLGQSHTGGLSSREGLAWLIHDTHKAGKEEIPEVPDKRLWVCESEFANVLSQSSREGNTLSAALRDAFDGISIAPATKNSRVWASDPHIALHGCITPEELREALSARELSNGFANRFLIFWAERRGLAPIPVGRTEDEVRSFADRVEAVVRFALGEYPHRKDGRVMTLSDQAIELYVDAYPELRRREIAAPRAAAALNRRGTIALRIAALFALCDQQLTIERRHLQAALAWSRYHRDSVRFIYGAEGEERRAAVVVGRNADKIVQYLAGRGWVSRSELANKCFAKRILAKDLNAALGPLLTDGLIEQQEQDNTNNPGRKTSYRLAETAESAESGQPRGFHGFRSRAESGGFQGDGNNRSEESARFPPVSAAVRNPQNPHEYTVSAVSAVSADEDDDSEVWE